VRLVHLSDLHLGYRQYQRLTPGGANQREADVARAFRHAVDMTISLRPDVVVVAGDVFHNVRPTNPAILFAFGEFARLTRELPRAIVVMIAGNHDTPRSADTGCILRLFAPLGITVVDHGAKRLPFPDRDLSILAVSDMGASRVALAPDPDARYNVLLLHGEVQGVLPASVAAADRAATAITPEELGAERWTYVALGHYHVYRRVADTAYYSGSLEYTSPNIWGERAEEEKYRIDGKGIIERDLATGDHKFHPIEPARALVDLPFISARGLTASDLDAHICAAVDACELGGIDDKIVRLVVRDVPRHVARELDQHALRSYKRRALNFHLDLRRPEVLRLHGQGAPGRRPSLADIVRDKLQSRLLEGDLDREALVALGLKYLADADSVAATAPAIMEEEAG
jgi:DNA repair protein SbcD/Mre11